MPTFERVEDDEYLCVGGPRDGDVVRVYPGDRERKAFWGNDRSKAHFYRIDRKRKRLVFIGTCEWTG